MKTRDEVEQLKRQWLQDPIWDIEDTDGFEDYREELIAYHHEQRQAWRDVLAPPKQVKTLIQSLASGDIDASDRELQRYLNDGWARWHQTDFQQRDGVYIWYERVVMLIK